jgi:hypothetical protein
MVGGPDVTRFHHLIPKAVSQHAYRSRWRRENEQFGKSAPTSIGRRSRPLQETLISVNGVFLLIRVRLRPLRRS